MRPALLALIAALAPVAHADELVLDTEPIRNGDDRVGKRLEKVLAAQAEALLACRAAATGDPTPARYLGLAVRFRLNGAVRTVQVLSSTGREDVDGCVIERVRAVVVDPPPQFPDLMGLDVTWRVAPATTP